MVDRIYVLIHQSGGQIQNISYECMVLGQRLARERGASVFGVVLGHDIAALGETLASAELAGVLVVDDPGLAEYTPDGYCEALVQLLSQDKPDLLLMGHVYQNIDLAPRLAGRLRTALVTDCTGYRMEDGELLFTRQMFHNKLNADIALRSEKPWIVTLQAGTCLIEELQDGSAPIASRPVDLTAVALRRKPLQTLQMTKKKVDLAQAEVIVGVGRGLKRQENLHVVGELAQVLGAEIGASRPAVDNEWLERDRQIGSSGQTVAPKLYIAVGISGAIQHVVGIKNSGCIVAINSDQNAPIFNVATYGIVGDWLEVVPALTKRLTEISG